MFSDSPLTLDKLSWDSRTPDVITISWHSANDDRNSQICNGNLWNTRRLLTCALLRFPAVRQTTCATAGRRQSHWLVVCYFMWLFLSVYRLGSNGTRRWRPPWIIWKHYLVIHWRNWGKSELVVSYSAVRCYRRHIANAPQLKRQTPLLTVRTANRPRGVILLLNQRLVP